MSAIWDPDEFEVAVMWSNGSCNMDLGLWGGCRLDLEKPQVCINHIQADGSLTSLSSFKTTSPFFLCFLGKVLKCYTETTPLPHVMISAHL